ncbi:MAG: hypothetical protein A2857_05290 [Candidatus Levybacteria bacterium RIFCSPHIGHO2_01_FULL_36_15]|nr:MAG: hypothetical protein A2857_05290 [Candidatus Levybacteria bacterium RIFCSPHIGHO2_01_FULL_36_15]OGH38470.1 MAG: hypothetical protein A2905_01545 [Candidatus Levybacteria bacterium RIFCSPLOWO2_01_FULL_36_10]
MENTSGNRSLVKPVIIGAFTLMFVNLLVLDFFIFQNKYSNLKGNSDKESEVIKSAPVLGNDCSPNCVARIDEALSSYKSSIGNASVSSDLEEQNARVKEYFVTFGAGSGNFLDWKDVIGLSAYVDGSKYGKTEKIVFEVAARIPNANQIIWIVLYNATDSSYVWDSQVTMSGGQPKLLVSKPFNLVNANKLYQVRLKTEVGDNAIIDQARLHIITE